MEKPDRLHNPDDVFRHVLRVHDSVSMNAHEYTARNRQRRWDDFNRNTIIIAVAAVACHAAVLAMVLAHLSAIEARVDTIAHGLDAAIAAATQQGEK